MTVDGRKSLGITVRNALLSKKAFTAFPLIGVTGNASYQSGVTLDNELRFPNLLNDVLWTISPLHSTDFM